MIVLLEELLGMPDEQLNILPQNMRRIEEFLRKSLLIVEVTRDEDLLLSKSGYQRAMPVCWKTYGHALYQDPLARYKQCGIDV